jgi:hypothetical protein
MRRLLIVLLALLLAIAGADVVWWRVTENKLDKGLAAQLSAARTAGWSVSASPPMRGGWPLTATLAVGDLILSGTQVTWSTDRLVLEVSLWHPLVLRLESVGMQRLRIGNFPEIPYTADTLYAAIPLQTGAPTRGFNLSMVNFRAGLGETGTGGLTVRALELLTHWTPAAQQNEPAIAASLNATDVRLPAGPAWPLGPSVSGISADLSLNGPLPRVNGFAERAASWRDAGGTMEVQHLQIDWGALDLAGTATLTLDEQLQPMGAGTLRVTDPVAALDALRENGALADNAVFAAKALLTLLSHTSQQGGKPEVDLPFTLQDRRLSISRFSVARLPHLDLP